MQCPACIMLRLIAGYQQFKTLAGIGNAVKQ